MNTTPDTTAFGDLLAKGAEAAHVIATLEQLLLDRFAALTRQGKITDRCGRKPEPIIDPRVRDEGGYGHWDLRPGWTNVLDTTRHHGDKLTFRHVTDADHSMSATINEYEVPLALLAVDPMSNEDYAEYLRLKNIFEPNAT